MKRLFDKLKRFFLWTFFIVAIVVFAMMVLLIPTVQDFFFMGVFVGLGWGIYRFNKRSKNR